MATSSETTGPDSAPTAKPECSPARFWPLAVSFCAGVLFMQTLYAWGRGDTGWRTMTHGTLAIVLVISSVMRQKNL